MLLLLACVTGASCGASYPAAPTPTPARLLLLSTIPLTNFRTNGSFDARAYLIDSDGVYTDVTAASEWQVSNALLRVTRNTFGTFVAAVGGTATGESTVSATYQGRSDSITVTILPIARPAPRLELSFSGSRLTPGAQSVGVSARYWASQFSSSEVAANYTISDPGVARIENARITAISPGRFTVIGTFGSVTEHAQFFVHPFDRLVKP